MLAPICLFTYKRIDETIKCVEALQKNFLAPESDLFIFQDGPKNDQNIANVLKVREYISSINGFKSVTVYISDTNHGLADSIISGVTKIINKYEKVIVLEDDLITSENFLNFMNQNLEFYQSNNNVLSISGYSFSDIFPSDYIFDSAFGLRASSWGWATWKNRWELVDWDVKTYSTFKFNFFKRLSFNKGGSDLSHMLDKQMKGRINSWAIRFCYHQYINNLVDVIPLKSKVYNIGFGKDATNSKKKLERFSTIIDCSNKTIFNLPAMVTIDKKIVSKFSSHHSITRRIVNRLF